MNRRLRPFLWSAARTRFWTSKIACFVFVTMVFSNLCVAQSDRDERADIERADIERADIERDERRLMEMEIRDGSNRPDPSDDDGRFMEKSMPDSMTSSVPIEIDPKLSGLLERLPIAALLGPPPGQGDVDSRSMVDDAVLVYQSGMIDLAMAHWMGQLAIDPESMESELSQIGYCAALRRPVTSLRFGVAISIKSEPGIAPEPLTATTTGSLGRSGSSRGSDDQDGYFDEDSGFETSIDSAAMMDKSMADKTAVTLPASLDGSMTDESATKLISDTIGLVGDLFDENFQRRLRAGQFGRVMLGKLPASGFAEKEAMTDGEQSSGGDERMEKMDKAMVDKMDKAMVDKMELSPSAKLIETVDSIPDAPSSWIPCVDFVGELPSDEAIVKARQSGLQFLFQFDVTLKPESASARTTGGTENITRVRVYDVRTGKSLYSTRSISSTDARRALARREFPDATAFVNDATRSFWSNFDRVINVVDMPEIQPENATRRVGQILASPSRTILDDLGEIRLYAKMGLLDEDQLQRAFAIVAGEDGLRMLYGTPAMKQSTTRQLIANAFSPSETPQ